MSFCKTTPRGDFPHPPCAHLWSSRINPQDLRIGKAKSESKCGEKAFRVNMRFQFRKNRVVLNIARQTRFIVLATLILFTFTSKIMCNFGQNHLAFLSREGKHICPCHLSGFLIISYRPRHSTFTTELDGWDESWERNLSAYFLPGSSPFLVKPLTLKGNFDLVFVVPCEAERFKERKDIRRTWAKFAWKMAYPVIFLVGNVTYTLSRDFLVN